MNTIVPNNYKTLSYTYVVGTQTVTVYNLFDTTLTIDSLALLTLQRTAGSFAIYAPSLSYVNSIGYSTPTFSPSTNASVGGSISLGYHFYAYTNVIGASETMLSPISAVFNSSTGTGQACTLTLPIGPIATSSRNVYRTNASTGSTFNSSTSLFYLVGSVSDNITTLYVDTTVDNTTTISPTSSAAYDIKYNVSTGSPTIQAGDFFDIEIRLVDQTYDFNFGIQRVIPQVMSELPPTDEQVAAFTDTNLTATATYFYQMTATGWRNYIFQMIASCANTGGIIKLYKALDPNAVVPANGVGVIPVINNWFDCTEEKFGLVNFWIGNVSTHVYKNLSYSPITQYNMLTSAGSEFDIPNSYLLSWTPLAAPNYLQVNVRQF